MNAVSLGVPMLVPEKTTVVSRHQALAEEVATQLREHGFGDTVTASGVPDAMRLRYHPGIDAESLRRLLRALRPHRFAALPDASLARGDSAAVVELGSALDPREISIEIATDTAEFGARMQERCAAAGFTVGEPVVRAVGGPQVLHGEDVGELELSVLRNCLDDLGIEAEFHTWPISGVLIQARDPKLAGGPARELFPVCVQSDDAEAASLLQGALVAEGFTGVETHLWTETETPSDRILVDPGPFTEAVDRARLVTCTQRICQHLGVDESRFPIQVVEDVTSLSHATIHLPVDGCRAGSLRPYAGTSLDRFRVRIVTNGGPSPVDLKTRLEAEGFNAPAETADGDGRLGFAIHYAEAARAPRVKRAAARAVRMAMAEVGATPEFPLHTYDSDGEESEIVIYFPTAGLEDGSLRETCSRATNHALTIIAEEASGLGPWVEELRSWGFAHTTVRIGPTPMDPQLQYGGAPALLLERLVDWLFMRTGRTPHLTRAWPLHDNDIWLSLPKASVSKAEPTAAAPPAPAAETPPPRGPEQSRVASGAAGGARPLIEVSGDDLRFADLELAVRPGPRHPLAPDPSAFGHFCIDPQTAATLHHVATSVLLAEPCLLEGETSTSKTSSVLYLAQLLDQPVVRVNLNGQTDTGELIGRYAPASASNGDGARNGTGWVWQDGLVVQAMRHGWWLLLDELNLAEPQILERLNSVLELQPSLVLTEHDNSVLGPGGEPVDPRFRVFATMNPAEYAGRSTLSPAYRNRWRGHLMVPQPGEPVYRLMLGQLVQGDVRQVTIGGRAYTPPPAQGPMAPIEGVADIGFLLDALARFHASVEAAAGRTGQGQLGANRRERYVFTRRDLLSAVFYIAQRSAGASPAQAAGVIRSALHRYYVARVADGEDRNVVVQLLDAAGVGPNTWHLGQGRGRPRTERR